MADTGCGPLSYLFLAAYDSMNQPLAALVPELLRRGSRVCIVANTLYDRANLSVFDGCGVEPVEVSAFDVAQLDAIDVVVMAPVCMYGLNRLVSEIRARCLPIVSFAVLFSSVVMREYPDLVLTLGEAKFDEFRENGLDYNMVAVGNPQYDALVRKRRDTVGFDDIERVLVIEQGGYPYGEKGKRELADTLNCLARRNPQLSFDVKPRFYPQLRGRKTHGQSESILDFMDEMPANLAYLSSPQPLEELIVRYDAVITTWSTAYLDAALYNVPLILIAGLDSADVFDVRSQRVRDAYEYLGETGCVHGYEELREWEGALPFSYVDRAYLAREVFSPETPCAQRAIHVIELACGKFWRQGRQWTVPFGLSYDEFLERVDMLEAENVTSSRCRIGRWYLVELNRFVQQWTYENRCLARPFPMEEFSAYYRVRILTASDEGDVRVVEGQLDSARERWEGLLDSFFQSSRVQEGLRGDAILQDRYIDWLRARGQVEEVETFGASGHVQILAKASLAYNRAAVFLERDDAVSAFAELQVFLDEVSGSGVKRFQKERRALQLMRPFFRRRHLGLLACFVLRPGNLGKIVGLLRQAIGDHPLPKLLWQARGLCRAL